MGELVKRKSSEIVPQSLSEMMQFCEMLSRSKGMVPARYENKPENILVAVQAGAEVGLKPLQSLKAIYVVNGTPALYGDAPLAIVRKSGLLEAIKEEPMLDASGEVIGYRCTVKRKGFAQHTQQFTMQQAISAGLVSKSGSLYKLFGARMLQFKARSWALRDQFGDVLSGLVQAEELIDVDFDCIELEDTAPDPIQQHVQNMTAVASPRDTFFAAYEASGFASKEPAQMRKDMQDILKNPDRKFSKSDPPTDEEYAEMAKNVVFWVESKQPVQTPEPDTFDAVFNELD